MITITPTTITAIIASILFMVPLCAAGINLDTTSMIMITRITMVESAFIVGFVRFVILYTTIDIFSTPFPVTK